MTLPVSRRNALKNLIFGCTVGGISVAALPTSAGSAPGLQEPGACTLFPQSVEGPFYFDPKLVRSDIAEGQPGLPIQLALRVIEAGPCTPIANARVDIWHADAAGMYSGYGGQGDGRAVSTKGKTHLRGTQMTGNDGTATFKSVFPGWYPGRTPHVHVKVLLDANSLVTGQIYFADDLSARVYGSHPTYANRRVPDTTNATDFLFKSEARRSGASRSNSGGGIVFAVVDNPNLIVASLVIAVDRNGGSARRA